MFSSVFSRDCRDESLRVRSDLPPGNVRKEPPRFTTLVKMVALVAALSLPVSCSTISKILTETDSKDGIRDDTVTGGNRIPLPPSVEDFESGRNTE